MTPTDEMRHEKFEHDASMPGATVQDEWGPWIAHKTGEPCPIPDAKAGEWWLRWKSGGEELAEYDAICMDWSDRGEFAAGDITHYRLRKPATPSAGEYDDYDAGLLNDFGGGNVEWWLDYLRAEIGRANDFWRSQTGEPATPPDTLLRDALEALGKLSGLITTAFPSLSDAPPIAKALAVRERARKAGAM